MDTGQMGRFSDAHLEGATPIASPGHRQCPSCQADADAKWQFCPRCGTATIEVKALEAQAPSLAVAQPTDELALSWSLFTRLHDAYTHPVDALFKDIPDEQAENLKAIIQRFAPQEWEQACMKGLLGMEQFETDETLPAPVRRALKRLDGEIPRIAGHLKPSFYSLESAIAALGGSSLLENKTEGFFKTLERGLNPASGINMLKEIGEQIHPGLGVALQVLELNREQNTANQTASNALEQYQAALGGVAEAMDAVFRQAWDQLVLFVKDEGGPALKRSLFFSQASDAFVEAAKRGVEMKESLATARELEKAVVRWGPHPEVLHLMVRTFLPPEPMSIPDAVRWASRGVELYPHRAQSFEDAADASLEQNDFERALWIAEKGLELEPGHLGLRASRLEALSAINRVEAVAEAEALRNEGYEAPSVVFPLRGLLRQGKAAAELQAFVQERLKSVEHKASVRYQLRKDPLIARYIKQGVFQIPGGEDDDLVGIVETYLVSDDKNAFLGPPPATMLQHALDRFLDLRPGERVLFFLDQTFRTNGKLGIAITNQRVQWQEFLDQAKTIGLRNLDPEQVRAENDSVKLGSFEFALRYFKQLAEPLAKTIKEMAICLQGASK